MGITRAACVQLNARICGTVPDAPRDLARGAGEFERRHTWGQAKGPGKADETQPGLLGLSHQLVLPAEISVKSFAGTGTGTVMMGTRPYVPTAGQRDRTGSDRQSFPVVMCRLPPYRARLRFPVRNDESWAVVDL